MDEITVLLVEPSATLQTYFEHILSLENDFFVIRRPDFFFEDYEPSETLHCDVLLLDADETPVTSLHTWAQIHVILDGVGIVALTAGQDDATLEAVLAGGINGVHRITVEPAILGRAVRHAARGIMDSDRELIDRAKRVVLQPLTGTQVRFGGLTIDFHTQQVTRWNKIIHLTPLEFRVIAHLARQPGRPISLDELLIGVWLASPGQGGTLAQVHNCIKRVRQKIEPDPQHPRYLLSERGWGYYLQDPTAMAVAHLLPPVPPEDVLPPKLIDN